MKKKGSNDVSWHLSIYFTAICLNRLVSRKYVFFTLPVITSPMFYLKKNTCKKRMSIFAETSLFSGSGIRQKCQNFWHQSAFSSCLCRFAYTNFFSGALPVRDMQVSFSMYRRSCILNTRWRLILMTTVWQVHSRYIGVLLRKDRDERWGLVTTSLCCRNRKVYRTIVSVQKRIIFMARAWWPINSRLVHKVCNDHKICKFNVV